GAGSGRTGMNDDRKGRGGGRQGGRGGPGGPRRGGGGNAGPRQAGGSRPPRGRRPQPPRAATPDLDVHDPEGVRLQKLLAAAGCGSRRACEKLIEQGRVAVDGQVVTELGVRVSPATQVVHVDGDRVVLDTDKVYLAFNKPAGVVSTMHD